MAVCRIGGGSHQLLAGVSCVSEVQVTSCLSWPNIQVMNWTLGATITQQLQQYNKCNNNNNTAVEQPLLEFFNFDIDDVMNTQYLEILKV